MKKILLLGDMHIGSLYAPWPEKFRAGDHLYGQVSESNRKLYKYWRSMIPKVKDVDAIIFNGDICDGVQGKSAGLGTVTTDLRVQIGACAEMIGGLPNVPKYFTKGTPYHSEQNRPLDESVCIEVDGTYGPELVVEECGIRLHCQHHLSTTQSIWIYEPTGLARDMMLVAIQNEADKYGDVDFLVRSHRHRFVGVMFATSMGVCTPGWQSKTIYAVDKGLLSLPSIGWVVIRVHDDHISVDRSGIAHVVRPCKVVGRDKK